MAAPDSPFSPGKQPEDEKHWIPMAIGAAVVAAVVIALIVFGRSGPPEGNQADPYLAKLQLSRLSMATAKNFVGGTVTYIQGAITNTGDKKVTGARVQVLFKNALNETVQKENLPITVLLPNLPYTDYGTMDRAPLAPGQSRDFRLTLEHVSTDWDGQVPQVKVVSVQY
jgi:uncharacterized protein DUF2393